MNYYIEIAEFYDQWCIGDPVFQKSIDFYVNLCANSQGKVIELGVGTGRIAIEIAKKGKDIIGVDICSEMLDKLNDKVLLNNLQDKIKIIHNDARFFQIELKADLITFPFRSIGYLLSLEEKEVLFKNIYNQLNVEGCFVFDHYIFDKSWATEHNGITRLMYSSNENEENIYIWDTYVYDFENQLMDCFVTFEKTNKKGIVTIRKIIPSKFSWVYPEQIEKIALKAGFKIDKIYGDFNGKGFSNQSNNQIWFLKK